MNYNKNFMLWILTQGILLNINFGRCNDDFNNFEKQGWTTEEEVDMLQEEEEEEEEEEEVEKETEYEDSSDCKNCFQTSCKKVTIDTGDNTIAMKSQYFGGKPLNSAFLNCGVCMTVTKKMNEVSSKHKQMSRNLCKNCQYPDLKTMCENSFGNYVLQEFNGEQFIGPSDPYLRGVCIPGVQSLPDMLEDMCLILVSSYGEKNIFDEWTVNPSKDLTNLLCRGEGLYGSCKNIEIKEKEIFWLAINEGSGGKMKKKKKRR